MSKIKTGKMTENVKRLTEKYKKVYLDAIEYDEILPNFPDVIAIAEMDTGDTRYMIQFRVDYGMIYVVDEFVDEDIETRINAIIEAVKVTGDFYPKNLFKKYFRERFAIAKKRMNKFMEKPNFQLKEM